MRPEREAEIRAEHDEPRDGRCDACDLLAALDAERKAHERTRAMRDDATARGYGDDAYIIGLESALADVRQRCGGYPDSRVDGDGGIVAVVVRERDEARGTVAALHERAASVLRGEADAIAALPVARLPVIATCGQCHDCDPPSYDTKPDERKAYCVHPAASAPPDNPATRVDRNASPPEWCPLRMTNRWDHHPGPEVPALLAEVRRLRDERRAELMRVAEAVQESAEDQLGQIVSLGLAAIVGRVMRETKR